MNNYEIFELLGNYNYVLYYLFKKKKRKNLINFKCIANNFNFFKIIFFFNIYFNLQNKDENEFYFQKYYFMKNFWYLFLNFYNLNYRNLKINIKNFFNYYILKNIGKSILFFNLKRTYSFFNINVINIKLRDIFKNKEKIKIIIYKKKISLNFYIKKTFNYWLNRYIKIKIPFYFFNNYKKKLFKSLVFFLTKCFKLDINKIEYVHYWKRFYIYTLKRIFVFFSYIFRKLLFFLFIIYKSFIKLLNWRNNFNKLEFIYFFYFKIKKGIFFDKFKLFSIFDNMYKLLNLKFYRKKDFFVYYFLIKKKKKKKFQKRINIELIIFRQFIKFKIQQFITMSFFLFFSKSISSWMNSFVQLLKNNKKNEHFFLQLKINIKNVKFFSKIKKREHIFILKKNYYIYDNLRKN